MKSSKNLLLALAAGLALTLTSLAFAGETKSDKAAKSDDCKQCCCSDKCADKCTETKAEKK